MKKYLINVPQGKSASFINSSTPIYGIEGLYTNNFTSCNILIGIAKDRFILMHIDSRMHFPAIKHEIDWLGDQKEVIILFRSAGKFITDMLLRYFSKELKEVTPKLKKMSDADDGIIVSITEDRKNEIHPQVKKLAADQNIDNLLFHPQEEKFKTVQVIEQIIGVIAESKTREIREKTLNIFNGLCWEPVPEGELKVDTQEHRTQLEMKNFQSDDHYFLISRKILKIIEAMKKEDIPIVGEGKDIADTMACHFEDYFNHYDAELIFKRNVEALLNWKESLPICFQDNQFRQVIDKLIEEKSPVAEIKKAMDEFKKAKGESTQFKFDNLGELDSFYLHYQDRMTSKKQYQQSKEFLQSAFKKSRYGKKEFDNKNYSAAANLFLETLREVTFSCLKNDKLLATTYYNCGRSLQLLGELSKAKFFMEIALTLKKQEQVLDMHYIKKIQSALQNCQEKNTKQIAISQKTSYST